MVDADRLQRTVLFEEVGHRTLSLQLVQEEELLRAAGRRLPRAAVRSTGQRKRACAP